MFFCDWFEKYLAERGIEDDDISSAIDGLGRRRLGSQERSTLRKLLTHAWKLINRLNGNG
jgi:hypothetical protein